MGCQNFVAQMIDYGQGSQDPFFDGFSRHAMIATNMPRMDWRAQILLLYMKKVSSENPRSGGGAPINIDIVLHVDNNTRIYPTKKEDHWVWSQGYQL